MAVYLSCILIKLIRTEWLIGGVYVIVGKEFLFAVCLYAVGIQNLVGAYEERTGYQILGHIIHGLK